MAKAVLSVVTDVVSGLTKNKNRRTLQPIQETANELKIIQKKMVNSGEKDLPIKGRQSKALEKIVPAEKENGPVTRRSKRRTAATETPVTNAECPELDANKLSTKNAKQKTKKTVPKSKKSKSTKKKTEEKNQTKLNFSPIPEHPITKVSKNVSKPIESEATLASSFCSAVTEDSGYGRCPRTSNSQESCNSIAVFNSPNVESNAVTPAESSILTIDSPPLSYWKYLAEQRRCALERALHENELLHDQMVVLEAENSQLKELVKEAEELARVVKEIVQ